MLKSITIVATFMSISDQRVNLISFLSSCDFRSERFNYLQLYEIWEGLWTADLETVLQKRRAQVFEVVLSTNLLGTELK